MVKTKCFCNFHLTLLTSESHFWLHNYRTRRAERKNIKCTKWLIIWLRLSPSEYQKKVLWTVKAAEEEFVSFRLHSVIRRGHFSFPQDSKQTFTLWHLVLHLQGDPNQEATQWEGKVYYHQWHKGRPEGRGTTELEEVQKEECVTQVSCYKPPSSETQKEFQWTEWVQRCHQTPLPHSSVSMSFIRSSFSCAVQWRGRRGWGWRRQQLGGGARDLWASTGRRPEIWCSHGCPSSS